MNVCPALVRREDELQMLTSNLGVGGLTLVTGEAGIGKSRLLRALADHAEDLGRVVLWGRPEVLSDPGPYSFIAGLLDESSRVPAMRDEASEVAELLNGSVEVAPRQVAARLRGLLSTLGPPPIVMLEDLQDADELSLAVAAHLARAARDDKVTMVGTFRPETSPALGRVLEAFERDRLATFIELQPLDRDAVSEMLRLMWDREPTTVELDEIVKLAEGVPFLTEELASTGADTLPDSVLRAVQSRLARLEPDAKRVVEVASLIVGAIDPELIARVGQVAEDGLPAHLVAAVRVGLLADRDGRLVFRHGLLRKAVAEGIVSVDRPPLHRRLAEEIERRDDDPSVHAAALARHHFEAGNKPTAARWAVVAGNRALAVAALDEARAQFEMAVDIAGEPQVHLAAREGLCEIAARSSLVESPDWEPLALGYEGLGDSAAAARCWLRRADVEYVESGIDAAVPFFERARSLLNEQEHPEVLAQVLIEMGGASLWSGETRAWQQRLEEGLQLAQSAERVDLAAEALALLGRGASLGGQLDDALNLEERACDAALASRNGSVVARIFKQHALTLLHAARADDALRSLDEAELWARRHVGDTAALSVNTLRAHVFYMTGQPARAGESAARLGASSGAYGPVALARFYALLEGEGESQARGYLDAWWDVLGEDRREACLTDPASVLEAFPVALLPSFAEMLIADATDSIDRWVGIAQKFSDYYSVSPPTTRLDTLVALGHAAMRLRSLEMIELILAEMNDPLSRAPYQPYTAAQMQLQGAALASAAAPSAAELLWESARRFVAAGNAVEAARSASIALEAVEDAGSVPRTLVVEVNQLAVEAGAATQRARLESLMKARGVSGRAGRPRGRPKAREGELSVREEEVAVLVAAGATNAEVARRLVLSERTVEDHIARAQRRLGVTGRAGLAAWAAKKGLV